MKLVFFITILMGIFFTVVILKKRNSTEMQENMPYKMKKILTETEQILFNKLKEALTENIIITQVQMSGFLTVTAQGRQRQAALNKILMKSVDFIVCKNDFSIVSVIELQDETHKRSNRQRNDEFKRKALQAANIKLIEYHVKNMPSTEEIRKTIIYNTSA